MPVLYSFRRCPYAMRARLAIAQAGVVVEVREIALRDKPAALLAASPKGTVPVLVLPEGGVLEQSLDIMVWALRLQDPAGWLTAAEMAQQMRWIALNDEQFKPLLDRYKYPQRFPEAAAASHRDAALDLMLLPLEHALASHAHLLGPSCSLADIALLPFVRQFAAVDAAWFEQQAPLPALRAWLRRLLALPLFEAVMVKRPLWQPPV